MIEQDPQIALGYVPVRPERLARMGDRAVAAILDIFIPFPWLFIPGAVIAKHLGLLEDNGNYDMEGSPAMLAMAIMALLWFTYNVIGETWFGGTPGKKIMGIRVRSGAGNPITLLQSVLRNLMRVIDAIGLYLVGFIIAICSDRRRRLGDIVAATEVFEVASSKRFPALLYGALIFVSGITVGSLVRHILAH